MVSGLHPATERPIRTRFLYGFPISVNLATECKSLTHYTKGTPSPLARLRLFVCTRFQDLFHSPPGVLFAFPSRYWFTIGRLRVFSLGGWSPHLQTGFHVSRPTCRTLSSTIVISCTGLSPCYGRTFQSVPLSILTKYVQAVPISLATTLGISVDFFSCSYLDVSVRRVRFAYLCIQYAMTYTGRVSPFGNLRIKACLPAPRSLSQATASFIACNRQGIHHVHLFACPYNVSSVSHKQTAIELSIRVVPYSKAIFRSPFHTLIQSQPYQPTRHSSLMHRFDENLYYFFQIVKERTADI